MRRPVELKQYAACDYRDILQAAAIIQSMSRKGNCWDNAPMESFFGTLKTELVHHREYPDRDTARRDLFAYIEGYYNRRRIHSAIGYITPQQAEAKSAQPSVHFPGGRSAGAISFEPFLVPMLDQHFAQNASGSRP